VLYWPDTAGATVTHGDITIECTDVTQAGGYLLSTLRLTTDGSAARVCEHYWYNSWPDHGVPKVDGQIWCDDVLNMLRDVNQVRAEYNLEGGASLIWMGGEYNLEEGWSIIWREGGIIWREGG
jgi:protein tyrosine phosphatase